LINGSDIRRVQLDDLLHDGRIHRLADEHDAHVSPYQLLSEFFHFCYPNLSLDQYKLKYKDEEGDEVTVSSGMELEEGIRVCERQKCTVLRLTLVDKEKEIQDQKKAAAALKALHETISVQITLKDNPKDSFLIRLSLDQLRFKHLLQLIKTKCELGEKALVLKYIDEEGDHITCSSDDDLDIALGLAKSANQILSLLIY